MIRRCAILACLAGAILAASPAAGQDPGGPAPPPAVPDASPAPPPPPPPQPDQPASADQTPPTPLVPPPAQVQAQSLDTLDLFSAGVDTGLGADLWKGSSAALARAVIPTLGDKPLSPAGVFLARRVLATGAAAPEGVGGDVDLAAARARALLALGDAADVSAIFERTPGVADSATFSQLAAEAALITDQPDKACGIGDGLLNGRDGLYWLRLRAYCQARQGKATEAQLTLTIAVQQGADAAYARLMTVLLANAGDPGAASLRDGLDYTLSRQLKLDLASALAHAPPAIAEHVRTLPPPPALPPAAPPAGVATPADESPPPPPPPPPSEADVLAALDAAKTPAELRLTAKAEAEAIDALVQAKTPLTQPVRLAVAAVLADDLSSAQAIRAGLAGVVPAPGGADLAILDAALAVAGGKPDPGPLDALVKLAGAADASQPDVQAATAIYAVVARPTTPNSRLALVGLDLGPPGASSGALLALDLAADAPARGDVALFCLQLAEAGGEAGPTPALRVLLERALMQGGLERAARAYALEGLIGLVTH